MNQVTKNCHFISRFLTKPWELQNRQLWYYDFELDEFRTRSSRSLFAADEINTQRVEDWLKRLIEDPLANVRPKLAAGDASALDDWRFFRAAALMVWMQGGRSKSVRDEDTRRRLDELASQDDAYIDQLVALIQQDYSLQVVFTVADGQLFAPLFFPSTGIFPIVFKDGACISGNSFGLGVPLDVHCSLVATPTDEGTQDLSRLPSSIANYSVGPDRATRVVIAPGVQTSGSEEDLRQNLKFLRKLGSELVANASEARSVVLNAFDVTGLRPEEDGAGRLRRPV